MFYLIASRYPFQRNPFSVPSNFRRGFPVYTISLFFVFVDVALAQICAAVVFADVVV